MKWKYVTIKKYNEDFFVLSSEPSARDKNYYFSSCFVLFCIQLPVPFHFLLQRATEESAAVDISRISFSPSYLYWKSNLSNVNYSNTFLMACVEIFWLKLFVADTRIGHLWWQQAFRVLFRFCYLFKHCFSITVSWRRKEAEFDNSHSLSNWISWINKLQQWFIICARW